MRTIRQQLTWKLLLGFALPLMLGGLAVFFLTRAALFEQFDATLRAQAIAITAATRQIGERTDIEVPDSLMRESDKHGPASLFQMWRVDGTTLRRSESLHASDLPLRYGTTERPKFWNPTLPSGACGRAIGIRFTPNIVTEGSPSAPMDVVLVVASDTDELEETLGALAFALFGCGAALLAITLVVVPRLLRRELAPLNTLAERAASVNAESLATRFPTNGLPGELVPIAQRLNDLLARLEYAFDRERQFSADLAHELRTPIAELRSLAEVAIKWPETREATTDREILAIALQMEGIVTRLLALLRCERGQLPVATKRVAVAPLIKSVWQTFAERAATKELRITIDAADGVEVRTDPVLLRSILTNLIDNAVEYTPRGGSIGVEGAVKDDRFLLRVTNTTDCLAPEDLTHLFERFWRKESARSDSKHVGLGLSLTKAFCDGLGLKLDAQFLDHSTLSITVTGPTTITEKRPR
jgi:two-component system sensor histidine kinase QseC